METIWTVFYDNKAKSDPNSLKGAFLMDMPKDLEKLEAFRVDKFNYRVLSYDVSRKEIYTERFD